MRILFTSLPAYGHVNTMLPLARQARSAGHDVAFATGAELVPEIERRGFETWQVGPSIAEAFAMVRAAYPDLAQLPPEQRTRVAAPVLFIDTAAKRAVELVPRAQQWKPDIIVREETELAGAIAAAHTGARHVVHGLSLTAAALRDLLAPGFAQLCQEWQVSELATGTAGPTPSTYLDICPPSLRIDGGPVWLQIQPLRPAAGEPAPGERLPEALAALPRLQTIHLTLGTVFNETPGVLETAIAGLRELPFNLVVTSGPGTDPARFGPQPPHVLIEPYIPHSLLLPHCCLVVAHGGAGIMLSTLAHGLPQLILPQGADQFANATACQSAGAALALRHDELSADAVASAAERLITDTSFQRAAAGIRAEIDAMPTPADVLAVLSSGRLATVRP
ncbi:MAG TPA: glycosyltransferase [Pseudonocardiaceae bacterium]|nr:glycosyltransferase [Pseudonocardiaceae bacterium]